MNADNTWKYDHTQIPTQFNRRVILAINFSATFGSGNKKPFVHAHNALLATCMRPPSPNYQVRGIEVMTHKINIRPDSIDIGAVHWPYASADDHERLLDERGQVKSAGVCWRYVRMSGPHNEGQLEPVSFSQEQDAWVMTRTGERVTDSKIERRFFSDRDFKAASNVGGRHIHPSWLAWMRQQSGRPHVLHTDTRLGGFMADTIALFDKRVSIPSSQGLFIPDMFVRGGDAAEYDTSLLDVQMIRAVRSHRPVITAELAPFPCIIIDSFLTDDGAYMEVVVAEVVRGGDGQFTMTGRSEALVFPTGRGTDGSRVTELCGTVVTPVDGEPIPPASIIGAHSPLVRVLPYDQTISSVEELRKRVGDVSFNWCRNKLLEQRCPVIDGEKAVSTTLLKSLPFNLDRANVFVHNRKVQAICACSYADLEQDGRHRHRQYLPMVRLNLLRHAWFTSSWNTMYGSQGRLARQAQMNEHAMQPVLSNEESQQLLADNAAEVEPATIS